MSAMGSVALMSGSPTCLRHPRNGALVRELAQADPAEAELPVDRPRAAAAIAALVGPGLELRGPRCLRDQALLRQSSSYCSDRNGRPSSRKSASASSSDFAVVVIVTSRPRTVSTSS